MGWPFKRKIKLEVTDAEKAKQDFFRDKQKNPPSSQECYKLFLKYHKRGSIFNSRLVYFLYEGRLRSIPRG